VVVQCAAAAAIRATLFTRVERAAGRAAGTCDRHAAVLVGRARREGQADAEQPLGAEPQPLEQGPDDLEREVLEEAVQAQDLEKVRKPDDADNSGGHPVRRGRSSSSSR
jgi:hypothetical protein